MFIIPTEHTFYIHWGHVILS